MQTDVIGNDWSEEAKDGYVQGINFIRFKKIYWCINPYKVNTLEYKNWQFGWRTAVYGISI